MDNLYCSTCRTPLTVYTNAAGEGIGMEHARIDQEDHQPTPVMLKDLPNPRQYCDFCSAEGPQWMIATRREVLVDIAENRVDNLGTTWLACDTCYILVENRNMEALLERIAVTFKADMSDTFAAARIRLLMEPIYVRLFEEMGEVELNPKGPQ